MRNIKNIKVFLFVIIILSIFDVAHPFGKNKIVYYTYDWKVLESAHFRIYITKEDLSLSNEIIETAENIYQHHKNSFGNSPAFKIKVIIYKNQIDFQQNNIVDWTSPGTGGFTEFIKGRVVIPYASFYPDFYHVLSHELNHIFQVSSWGKGNINRFVLQYIDIPLWIIEGASEYNSIGLDKECEMIIADGVINGILPSLERLSDLYNLDRREYFYVYKEGQIFYQFISEKYGKDIYAKLHSNISEHRRFNSILSNTFQKNLIEINDEFFDYLRKRYLADIRNLKSVETTANRVIKEDSDFNMNPVELSSSEIAFISDRDIYPSIMIYDRNRNSLQRIFRGGFDEDFLEFHYGKRNNLSVSTNGILCFVSRSGGEDVIHLYDIKKRKTEKLSLPFRIINSPDISRDGNLVLFSAVSNQQTDIYIYNRNTKNIIPVFQDKFYDTQPRFIDTNRIVFASNRKNGITNENLDIFIYNLETKKYELVIDTYFSDEYPAVSKDGKKIAFIRFDIHPALMIYSLEEKKLYEEIVPTGGILCPSFTESGNILMTVYSKNKYNLYEYKPNYTNSVENYYFSTAFSEEKEYVFYTSGILSSMPYQTEFSVDNLFGGLAFNTSLGAAAIGIIQFSDLLGDEKYQIMLDSTIVAQENFLDYLNIDFLYKNLRHRNNYGIHLFYFSNYFFEFNTFQDFFNMEKAYYKTYGGFLLYSYPLTTFDRFDVEAGYRGFDYIENIREEGENVTFDITSRHKNIASVSFVHDSTLWNITGPVDGIRYEAILSKSFALYPDSISYEKMILDFRGYFLILPNILPGYSFAFRGVAGKVFGVNKDESPFYLGGFNSIRGYNLWDFKGDTMYLLNFELRMPFIYDWTIGFPFPIRLPTIWGVLFWDFGSAWNATDFYQAFENRENLFYFKDLKSGLGFGFRLVLLPGIKLMFNYASPFDGQTTLPFNKWQSFWFIGIDF